jgi:hypothetical protein
MVEFDAHVSRIVLAVINGKKLKKASGVLIVWPPTESRDIPSTAIFSSLQKDPKLVAHQFAVDSQILLPAAGDGEHESLNAFPAVKIELQSKGLLFRIS